MPIETKPWWQSKTIAFNVAAIVALYLASRDIQIDAEIIAAAILNVASIVGRIVARKKIKPMHIKRAW